MAADQVFARAAELLWTGGLAATPLAAIVAIVCRSKRVRPATRHMLWLAVLASFITPVVSALIWKPHWFRSDRLIAAADSVFSAPADVDRGPEARSTAGKPIVAFSSQRPTVVSSLASPTAIISPSEHREVPSARGKEVEVATDTTSIDGTDAFVGPFPIVQVTMNPPDHDQATAPDTVFEASVGEIGPDIVPASSPWARSVVTADAPTVFSPLGDEALMPKPAHSEANQTGDHLSSASELPTRRADVGGLRAWLVRVLDVRDALAALPPVPTSLWFSGAALVIMMSVWRRFAGMMWLRHSVPADPHVQAIARQVGETLGLSRIPRVVFVEAAISPMIWCGLRPLLVLPRSLWRTLDEDSRRAVLVHELAHVRRWDHVLCWLEAVVGALYWWHPVVWWARRRLHEEAEASCDAWVTTLFPANRRAYASALLVTKSFVSSRAESRGPWLGVASGSAKRLARRITMVMTHKAAPRISMLGACVTALVVATGAFVMPGLACPPVEEDGKPKSGQQGVFVTRPARNRVPQQAVPAQPGVTFFGEAPALEAMRTQPEAPQHAPHPAMPPSPAHAPRAPRPPAEPSAPALAPVPMTYMQPGAAVGVGVDLDALKEGRTPREYRLSSGKLEAFYGMMSRNDVPILVQMGDDHMVIWGTDDEHAVFSKFVRIVDGKGDQAPRGVIAIEGRQLPALSKLDAEKMERAIAGSVRAGQGAEKAAIAQYRTSLRDLGREREAMERAAEKAREDAEAASERAEEFRDLATELRGRASNMSPDDRQELEKAARALYTRSDALHSGSKSLEQAVKDLERQIRQLEERARKLEQDRDNPDQSAAPAKKRKGAVAPGMLASLGAERADAGSSTATCVEASECSSDKTANR